MPELPEVQTVVNDLNEKIKGDVITDFSSVWPKTIKGKTLRVFKKEIIGRKVLGVRRLGKNIFIDLEGGKTLYIHLKMTGHLLIKSQIKDEFRISNFDSNSNLEFKKLKIKNSKLKSNDFFADRVNQYIRHVWTLRDKKGEVKTLEFSDMRKFAKIVLVNTQEISALPEIKSLGVDAMSAEFTLARFNDILDRKKKTSIGVILMDQHLIAGIGNIYRSEILFEAGVAVDRKGADLTGEEKKRIFKATIKILKKATKMRGTTDSDFRDTSGAPGRFQTVLKVYGKTGKECPKCGNIIKRKTIGQRSVFYCEICQK